MDSSAQSIGEILLEEGVLTAEDIKGLIEEGGWKGTPLARALQASPHVGRADLVTFLGSDSLIPHVDDLRDVGINHHAVKIVSATFLKKNSVLPIAKNDEILVVVATNAITAEIVGQLRKKSERRVKVLLAETEQVEAGIEKYVDKKNIEIPSPKKKTPETTVRRATPAVSEDDEDLVPLISMGDEEDTGAHKASQGDLEELELEEVVEVLDAVPIPANEFEQTRRLPAIRMALEFSAVHDSDRPVAAIRVS